MTILSVLAIILMLLGLFFFLAGTIGLLRLPDFYSRLHAAGKCRDGRLQPRVFLFRNTVGKRQALSDCRVCLCYQPDGNPCNHRSRSGSWRKALEADGGKTTMIWQLDLMILTLVVICALVAINIKDLLGAAVVFGIYSFLMCLLWAEMGAVDVAFTEATVGAGVSTIFFIAAILRTTRRSRD